MAASAGASWVKSLFTGLDKQTDILNVGRLIFYTAGGLLASYPLMMTARMLRGTPTQATEVAVAPKAVNGFFATFDAGLGDSPWITFFVALVVGFLVAQVAFMTMTLPAYARVKKQHGKPTVSTASFNYLYPYLKDNEDDEDYQDWLIREYFRYVEIGSIIPLGLFIGITLLGFHTLVYLLVDIGGRTPSDGVSALVFLNLLAISLATLRFYVWPIFWRPKIFDPTVWVYIRAKTNLVEGVRAIRPEPGAGKES